jgi:hypothetical protein
MQKIKKQAKNQIQTETTVQAETTVPVTIPATIPTQASNRGTIPVPSNKYITEDGRIAVLLLKEAFWQYGLVDVIHLFRFDATVIKMILDKRDSKEIVKYLENNYNDDGLVERDPDGSDSDFENQLNFYISGDDYESLYREARIEYVPKGTIFKIVENANYHDQSISEDIDELDGTLWYMA